MPSGHVFNAGSLFVWSLLELNFAHDAADERTKLAWFLIIVLLMGPVPWARWHNRDHSAKQCAVSMALGCIAGGVGAFIRKTHYPHHYQWWETALHVY